MWCWRCGENACIVFLMCFLLGAQRTYVSTAFLYRVLCQNPSTGYISKQELHLHLPATLKKPRKCSSRLSVGYGHFVTESFYILVRFCAEISEQMWNATPLNAGNIQGNFLETCFLLHFRLLQPCVWKAKMHLTGTRARRRLCTYISCACVPRCTDITYIQQHLHLADSALKAHTHLRLTLDHKLCMFQNGVMMCLFHAT